MTTGYSSEDLLFHYVLYVSSKSCQLSSEKEGCCVIVLIECMSLCMLGGALFQIYSIHIIIKSVHVTSLPMLRPHCEVVCNKGLQNAIYIRVNLTSV